MLQTINNESYNLYSFVTMALNLDAWPSAISVAKTLLCLSSGLFFFGNLVADTVALPAIRQNRNSKEYQLKTFTIYYERAKVIFGSSAVISALCHAYVFYVTRRRLYLAGCSSAILVPCYTYSSIIPDVNLLKDMSYGKRSKDNMKEVFDRWTRKSKIRAYVIFSVSYGVALWTIIEGI